MKRKWKWLAAILLATSPLSVITVSANTTPVTSVNAEGSDTSPGNTGGNSGGGNSGGQSGNNNTGSNSSLSPNNLPSPNGSLSGSGTSTDSTDSSSTEDKGVDLTKLSPTELTQFQQSLKDIVNNSLRQYLENAIKSLQQQSMALTQGTNFGKQQLADGIYYNEVASYLSTNLEGIIANPSQYGFEFVLPGIVENNTQFKYATIVFDGKTYENVMLPAGTNNPYETAAANTGLQITTESNQSSTSSQGSTSSSATSGSIAPGSTSSSTATPPSSTGSSSGDSGAIFTKTTGEIKQSLIDYVNKFGNNIVSLLTGDGNNPTISGDGPNAEIDYQTLDGKTVATLKPPVPIDSWNVYIQKLLQKNTIKFDLQENSKQEDKKQKPTVPPINQSTPPQVTPDYINQNIQEITDDLQPILNYEYIDSFKTDPTTLIQTINGAIAQNASASNTYFFFNEFVNTRLSYQVTNVSLDSQTNEVIATIKISDNLFPDQSRTFTKPVLAYSEQLTAFLQQQIVNKLKAVYGQFYSSLGIGADADLSQLSDQSIASAVYEMIFSAFKFEHSESFVNAINNLIANNFSKLTIHDSPALQSFLNQAENIFLTGLTNQILQINLQSKNDKNKVESQNIYYYSILPNIYQAVYQQFYNTLLNNSQTSKNFLFMIQNNTSLLPSSSANGDKWGNFGVGLQVWKNDILKLKAYAQSSNINSDQLYETYNALVSRIQKQIATYAELQQAKSFSEEDVKNKAQNVENFVKLYDAIITTPFSTSDKEQFLNVQKILTIILGAILALASVSVATMSGVIYKIQNAKYKSIKTKYILISLSLVAIPLIVAVVLLGIAFGGL